MSTHTNKRREVLKMGSKSLAASMFLPPLFFQNCSQSNMDKIVIKDVASIYEKQALKKPFGFKGSEMTDVWQVAAKLRSVSGHTSIGLGTQNVLWSDAGVFDTYKEEVGNQLMYKITNFALDLLKGQTIDDPVSWQEENLEEVLDYGKTITKNPSLRKTFALNALVPVDNALWLLYAAEKGYSSFDQLTPPTYQSGLSAKHNKVVSIPALGYGTNMDSIKSLADQGYFIMKIKIGAPGTQAEMLKKDIEFLDQIHQTIGHYETEYSNNGKLPYYFDANGRYNDKDSLHRFLDHAEKIGAIDQIAVIEEPFGERNKVEVNDLAERGPRIAADESAHTDIDALERIKQGYNAIAVKAVAKTMSMTMKIAQVAYDNNVPCFCADLTVNPILVDWNKIIAARLPAFPEMKNLGLQETNGWQNYKNWNTMMERHPAKNANWVQAKNGVYETGNDFFEKSGGIFLPSEYYNQKFEN